MTELPQAEHEYVDYVLDVKNGEIVSCEFMGEGRQVEPLTEPQLFRFLEGDQFPRGWKRIERRIRRLFRKLGADGESGSSRDLTGEIAGNPQK